MDRSVYRHGRDRMLVGFTTTYAISVDHQYTYQFESRSWRCVLDTTLCAKVCQWLAAGWLFSLDTPGSSTNISFFFYYYYYIYLKGVFHSLTRNDIGCHCILKINSKCWMFEQWFYCCPSYSSHFKFSKVINTLSPNGLYKDSYLADKKHSDNHSYFVFHTCGFNDFETGLVKTNPSRVTFAARYCCSTYRIRDFASFLNIFDKSNP